MGWRLAALTFGVIVVVLVALMVFDGFPGKSDGAEAQAPEVQLYEGIPLDATLLPLDKKALEEAYNQYLLLLFSVWLKGDITQDEQIKNGLRKARAAYNSAARQIANREQELLERDRQQQQHAQ